MTIAISLKVNDGLVLATDSASTISSDSPAGQSVLKVYNNANKIFNVYKGLPIGVITWGLGSIGEASTSTLVKDLRRQIMSDNPAWPNNTEGYTVKDVASKVRNFFSAKYEERLSSWPGPRKQAVGFIVAGYSRGKNVAEDVAEEYQFTVGAEGASELQLLRSHDQSGITWNGMIEPISRLLVGYSPFLPGIIQNRLGLSPTQLEEVMTEAKQGLQASLALPPMPLQDAIDLAKFLVDLTINYFRFFPGPSVVGGPMEVAAISKHEGFKWIHRKHYYTSELNP